jgi:hypothetical protein
VFYRSFISLERDLRAEPVTMPKRWRAKSTARDPFSAYHENTAVLDVYEDFLKGTRWPSSEAGAYTVDWNGFLGDSLPHGWLPPLIVASAQGSGLPIASVLVGYTASFFDFQWQAAAEPTFDEKLTQLRLLRDALRRAGSIAQGSDGSGPIDPAPRWSVQEKENPDRQQLEAIRFKRTSALHPALVDFITHVGTVFDGRYDAVANVKETQSIVDALNALPTLIRLIERCERLCSLNIAPSDRARLVGAPSDKARDWALIRLMWTYRDVFGKNVKIYLRRIRAKAELSPPEPEGCMAFVVEGLRHFSPVEAHELPGLERRLIALRKYIPATPLVEHSRPN